MHQAIRKRIEERLPELVVLRHEFHRNPERSFEEHVTADRIVRFLDEAGIPHTRGHARGTGIVARIEGAGKKAVVLRADMDALPITEETGLEYVSRNPGCMHACGHDGHMTMLCGAAQALMALRADLPGTVHCIFQPAEEQFGGGRLVAEEGLLDGVDAAFALHAWPGLPLGQVAIPSGPVMASADFFRIAIQGRGGHGANPGATVDPVVVAAHVVTALQSIVAREVDPRDAAVVTIGRLEAGRTANIIPDAAQMEGTIRALSPEVRRHLAAAVERVAVSAAAAHRATAEVFIDPDTGYPPLNNDPAMSERARETALRLLGNGALAEFRHPAMVSEDFAYYLERVPGAYILLGNGGEGPPGLHTPQFNFDDAAIPVGASLLAAIAADFLAEA